MLRHLSLAIIGFFLFPFGVVTSDSKCNLMPIRIIRIIRIKSAPKPIAPPSDQETLLKILPLHGDNTPFHSGNFSASPKG